MLALINQKVIDAIFQDHVPIVTFDTPTIRRYPVLEPGWALLHCPE